MGIAENGPEKASEPERHEQNVENHEANLEVAGEKTAHKSSGGEHVIKPMGILLDRVSRLGQDQ
jgi:hypothetical protein